MYRSGKKQVTLLLNKLRFSVRDSRGEKLFEWNLLLTDRIRRVCKWFATVELAWFILIASFNVLPTKNAFQLRFCVII